MSDSSSPLNLPLPPQSYESQPFPLLALPLSDIPVEQGEEFRQHIGPLYLAT